MAERAPTLSELDTGLVRLQLAASAIAEKRSWEGYGDNVAAKLAALRPEDDPHVGERDFQLRIALSNGDKNRLIALAADSYLGQREQDPYPVTPAFVAEELDMFALELQRVGAKLTHAGALIAVSEGIKYAKDERRFEDEPFVNAILKNLRIRERDHAISLGLKMSGVALAGVVAKKILF